jgi:hypothetical protein
MSQNLTQPEEVDHALLEMSWRGLKLDALANDIKDLYKADHGVKCGESIDINSSSYSAMHRKSVQSLSGP